MATATSDEIIEFTKRLEYLNVKRPAWLADYINKSNGGRKPYEPWPPDGEEIEKFFLASNSLFQAPEEKAELANTIDAKKLEDLVDICNKESKKIAVVHTEAERKSQKLTQDLIKLTLEQKDVRPNQRGTLFRIIQAKSEREPDRPIEDIVPEAVASGEASLIFSDPEISHRAKSFVSTQFKDLKSLSSFQKTVTAPLLDVVTDVATTVFPGLKQGVMNKSLAFALEDLLKKTDNLTRIFGQNIVSESWYESVIKNAGQIIAQGKSSGGAKTIIDDLATSLFRGPTSQTMISYVEYLQINLAKGTTPMSANEFMAANMGLGSSAFHFALNEAKGFAVKKGLIAAGGEALAAALGGPPGWIAGLLAIGGGLLGKIGGGLMNLTGLKPGKVSGDQTLVGLGCGALIAVFILMLLAVGAINDSLNIHLGLGGQSSSVAGSTVDCSQTPNDPQCKFTACTGDCQWPASGIITQGPFTGGFCGNPAETSHDVGNAANGIDIANPGGGPVYTPRAGTVTEAYTQCANNSGRVGNTCGGSPAYAGYGNHVILKTDDGYTLIFGHMENAMNITAGQHVDAGAQLGWMDQTGNSTGTHLHFGVLSGGSVLDFVPKNDPAHAPGEISGCVDGEPSCKKTCPYTPVTAGK